ncbi:hypothetical protein CEN49_27775 [Fischerella thermalis CCMEE 5273]|nr:hypothetical protein CEN49_27775 [Fischerella thermalis CCMEE 5273]
MWKHGNSREPRPHHLAMNGRIFPALDPWWDTNYPPSGWGCKCLVVSLSKRDVQRMGKEVEEAPRGETYEWRNPLTGQLQTIRNEPDTGWNYAPGKSRPEQRQQMLVNILNRLPPDLRFEVEAHLVNLPMRPAELYQAQLLVEDENLSESFRSLVDDYYHVVDNPNDTPLTEIELAAIRQYTGGGARRINALLRRRFDLWEQFLDFRDKLNDESLSKAQKETLLISRLAATGLSKLPKYEGVVYRNTDLTPEQDAKYEIGEIISELSFFSTSKNPATFTRGSNTLFVIDSLSGKDIQSYSRNPREQEILFSPMTRFYIVDKYKYNHPATGDIVTVIVMREENDS